MSAIGAVQRVVPGRWNDRKSRFSGLITDLSRDLASVASRVPLIGRPGPDGVDAYGSPNPSGCSTSRGGARAGASVDSPRYSRQRWICAGSQTTVSTRLRTPQGQARTSI